MEFTDLELYNIQIDVQNCKKINKKLIDRLNDRFCFLSAVNNKFDLMLINNSVVQEYLTISIILKRLNIK